MRNKIIKILCVTFLASNICFSNQIYGRYDYYEDYDYNYNPSERLQEQEYYPIEENYTDTDYNERYVYKNGDECINIKMFSSGCYFNGVCYSKPKNAKCIIDKYNAWKCNEGFIEKNGNCTVTGTECFIKGNISFNANEKIYHLPDCENYDDSIINERYGERYFCTEDEAIKLGWKKAKNCPDKTKNGNLGSKNIPSVNNTDEPIKYKNRGQYIVVIFFVSLIAIFIFKYIKQKELNREN